jgi:hypothetical protein
VDAGNIDLEYDHFTGFRTDRIAGYDSDRSCNYWFYHRVYEWVRDYHNRGKLSDHDSVGKIKYCFECGL